MGSNLFTDSELTRLFEKDAVNLAPDTAVRERLEYTFLLKSKDSKVKQNSFLGMFTWLFSWSHLPLKAAMVSLILVVSLLRMPSVEQQFLHPGQDTTYNTIPLLIDSSETSPYYADTCLTTKAVAKVSSKVKPFLSEAEAVNHLQRFMCPLAPRNRFSNAVPTLLFLNRHSVSRKSEPVDLNNLTLFESRQLA